MKTVMQSTSFMFKMIKKDKMLLAAGFAPVLAGLAIHFGIPALDSLIIDYMGRIILHPYFNLFDIFYASLSPAMLCFIAAMVILEERDDKITRYYCITPLKKTGYIISRIMIPAIISCVVTLIFLPVFCISDLSAPVIVLLSISGGLQGVVIGFLIITISTNKLEGMAVTKMSSLLMMGALVPYFVPKPVQYIFAFLPSYWMASGFVNDKAIHMFISSLVSIAWCIGLMVLPQKNRTFAF